MIILPRMHARNGRYGYEPPSEADVCYRYGAGEFTTYLATPEPCNLTLGYTCYDPIHQTAFNASNKFAMGANHSSEVIGAPYHPARRLPQLMTFVYWVLFIFIGSFVLLSLFIGAITIGM